jgi:hypothetical protein
MMSPSPTLDDVASTGAELLGWRGASATPVRGGGNNRIFRLEGSGGTVALKLYPSQQDDARDRLGQEFAALSFLSGCGVRQVPRPIAQDRARRCAAYEWVSGTPAGAAGPSDVDCLADFFIAVQELRGRPGAEALPAASASCFSPQMVARQLQERLQRIGEVAAEGSELAIFLEGTIRPNAADVADQLRKGCALAGIDFEQPLPRSRCALSPSDFGLHNSVRRPDGSLTFVDFEYFGWDDPAKAVADAMLHPGSGLSADLARRYRSRVEGALQHPDDLFGRRLDLFFPAIVLIWCLILLNEFLPERWMRRTLAGETAARATAQARQLGKARELLARHLS